MSIFAIIAIAVAVWWLFDILTAGTGSNFGRQTPRQRQRAGLKPLPPSQLDLGLSRRQWLYGEKLWKAHEAARHH